MLTVTDLHSHYGRAHILRGVSFGVSAGEAMVMIGRNGAGKSTTLKSLMGLVRPSGGRIVFAGAGITNRMPHRIAQAGIGYVPEDRRIFAGLTVSENLAVGRRPPRDGRPAWTEQRLFELFPDIGRLRNRLGNRMSGGEQQMLAIARTLMGNPSMLLLDEPNEGLAPVIVERLANAILALKQAGVTLLIAEQNLSFAAQVADRAAVIETGRIVWSGSVAALLADHALQSAYLSV
jgi:branched-chain amino acid transport system ATP-binding protein